MISEMQKEKIKLERFLAARQKSKDQIVIFEQRIKSIIDKKDERKKVHDINLKEDQKHHEKRLEEINKKRLIKKSFMDK